MKNILPVSPSSTTIISQDKNLEEFSSGTQVEDIVLYDECGDTQWDKVLEQHDLADQSCKVIINK